MNETTAPPPRNSPLHESHLLAGGKLVDFAGWNMPVQYSGIMPEHNAVRTKVGMFDISHMGQIIVKGPQAWLDGLLTNALSKLSPGQGQYTLMLNEAGGVIDDLIVYQTALDEWFLVVNASKRDEDWAWLSGRKSSDITLADESDETAGIAIQGPEAAALFAAWTGQALPPRNGISKLALPDGTPATICRTGYTGEDGYELFCPAASGPAVWAALLAQGIAPCGLGARDSLRLEMGYPLNGQDLTASRTPVEAGLSFFCDLTKDFVGAETLRAQKAAAEHDRLVGFKMLGACPPPRSHFPVKIDGEAVGETTSGGFAPSVGCGIGMAYIPAKYAKIGGQLQIDIRGKLFPAEIVKRPFWKPTLHS
jgi:aminomethyltransferase